MTFSDYKLKYHLKPYNLLTYTSCEYSHIHDNITFAFLLLNVYIVTILMDVMSYIMLFYRYTFLYWSININ